MAKWFLQDQELAVAILLVSLWATTDPPALLLLQFVSEVWRSIFLVFIAIHTNKAILQSTTQNFPSSGNFAVLKLAFDCITMETKSHFPQNRKKKHFTQISCLHSLLLLIQSK